MPKKTLALITGLVLVTVILFLVALRAGQQQNAPSVPKPSQTAEQKISPVPAHTILTLSPNPLNVAPGQQGKAEVTIDTSDNEVTAVQLEVGYDPTVLTNVQVTAGTLFKNPVVLYSRNDTQAGRLTYAFGNTPGGQPLKGKGTVATITFTASNAALGKETQLGLLPTTLVTARGVAQSVMKSGTGTVVVVGNAQVVPDGNTTTPQGQGVPAQTSVQPTQASGL